MSQSLDAVVELVSSMGPTTAAVLFKTACSKWPDLTEDEFLGALDELEAKGRLELSSPGVVAKGMGYLRPSFHNLWFYIVVIFAGLSLPASVYLNSFPLVIIRWAVVIPLLTLFPGFVTLKTLFAAREFNGIEWVVFSLVVGVVIVSFIGLALNLTPLGLRTLPISGGVAAYVTVLSIAGLLRQYQGDAESRRNPQA